jgi:hypothetical protein
MPRGKSPSAIQDQVRQIWYSKILPRLDDLFSGLVTDDVILRIDRLELDLGTLAAGRLEQDLTEQTLSAVRKSLEEQLKFGVQDSGVLEVIPVQRSAAETLLYFLRSGRLPWWSAADDLRQLETRLLGESPFLHPHPLPAGFPTALRSLIAENAGAAWRLVWQFSDPFLGHLIQLCFPAAGYKSPQEERMFFKAAPDRFIARYLAETASRTASQNSSPTSSHDEAAVGISPANILKKDTPDQPSTSQPINPLPGDLRPADPKNKVPPAIGEDQQSDIPTPDHLRYKLEYPASSPQDRSARSGHPNDPSPSTPAGHAQTHPGAPDAPARAPIAPRHGAPGDPAHASIPPRPAPRSRPTPEDEEGVLYTGLAGLVLLHPFLTDFFNALHLLEDKAFIDEAARHKAVHLLGYLGLGEEEIEEPLLAFPKMLCGMETHTPVQRTGVLAAEEREESEQLLNAVIGYWTALKSTSPAGLRDSFLKREGKLSRKDGSWQLDVEKKTLDVLLGKLP